MKEFFLFIKASLTKKNFKKKRIVLTVSKQWCQPLIHIYIMKLEVKSLVILPREAEHWWFVREAALH